MRHLTKILMVTISICAVSAAAKAQQKELSDAQYIVQATSAAPLSVAKEAAVVRMGNDGSMKTLRAGKNGFTCMIMGTDKMCNDANSMEFIHAMMMHQPPSE